MVRTDRVHLPQVGGDAQLARVGQTRDAIDILREMGMVAATVLVQRGPEVAEGEADGARRLEVLLDLSDDFVELYEWYDEACSAHRGPSRRVGQAGRLGR